MAGGAADKSRVPPPQNPQSTPSAAQSKPSAGQNPQSRAPAAQNSQSRVFSGQNPNSRAPNFNNSQPRVSNSNPRVSDSRNARSSNAARSKEVAEIRRLGVAAQHSDAFVRKVLEECGMDVDDAVSKFKLIQQVKEVAAKHGDDDILAMLKDCNLDPNEAAQRLMYIDTFHEVKRKPHKKKVVSNSGPRDGSRWIPRNQWQGSRGGRVGYSSPNISNDVRAGEMEVSRKDDGATYHKERVPGPSEPVHVTENNVIPSTANGPRAISNGVPEQLSKDPIPVLSSKSAKTGIVGGVINGNGGQSEFTKPGSELPTGEKPVAESMVTANSESIPEEEKLPEELEKSTPVIFPDNILVPETVMSLLTFGSLNADPIENFPKSVEVPKSSAESVEGLKVVGGSVEFADSVSESVEGTTEAVVEASLSAEVQNPTDQEGEVPSGNALPVEEKILSDSFVEHVESKQDIPPIPEAVQHSALLTASDLNSSIMSHVLGPHLVHPGVPEQQGGNEILSTSGPTPAAAQAVGAGQNIPLSPPIFPYFRHPYSPGFIPYNPYYGPPIYYPQAAHQMLSHNGFFQQPGSGNVFANSATAGTTPGSKTSVTSSDKPGANAVNLTQFGLPSVYASYASTPVGFGATVTTEISSAAEDLPVSVPMDKVFQPPGQQTQGEDTLAWPHAQGRALPSLPSVFYNYAQGHHLPAMAAQGHHLPAMAGVYPSQIMAAQPTGQSLVNQSQPVESAVVPPSFFQMPQHASMYPFGSVRSDRETS